MIERIQTADGVATVFESDLVKLEEELRLFKNPPEFSYNYDNEYVTFNLHDAKKDIRVTKKLKRYENYSLVRVKKELKERLLDDICS